MLKSVLYQEGLRKIYGSINNIYAYYGEQVFNTKRVLKVCKQI